MNPGYLEAPFGPIHYYATERTDDPVPLIMLHQSPLSAEMHVPLLEALEGRRWCVAIDTPGYGRSSRPSEDLSLRDLGTLVWQWADQLGAGRATLFGRATGGALSVAAAVLAPERTEAVVLHTPPLYTAEELVKRRAESPVMSIEPDGSHLQWIWDRVTGEYPHASAELRTYLARCYLDSGPDFAFSYRAIWNEALDPWYRDLRVPCYGIVGTRDRIAHMFPRVAEVVDFVDTATIEGADDFISMQDPGALVETLARWGLLDRGAP